jgi:hypothetical protein
VVDKIPVVRELFVAAAAYILRKDQPYRGGAIGSAEPSGC